MKRSRILPMGTPDEPQRIGLIGLTKRGRMGRGIWRIAAGLFLLAAWGSAGACAWAAWQW